jgi:polyisoprenoid-binding protein YceI
MENIDATTTNVQSIVNSSLKTVAFIIPIRSFRFKSDLMQEHFNEKYMESDKYPTATFNGKVNEDVDLSKDGCYKVTSSGKMKMHGVERDVTYEGTATVKDGELSLDSDFPIAVKDYRIEIPKLLFQNIADTVTVKMNLIYQPYRK